MKIHFQGLNLTLKFMNRIIKWLGKYWFYKSMFLVSVTLFAQSCGNKTPKRKLQTLQEKWFGNWVLKSVFDSIQFHDSVPSPKQLKLSFNNFSCTEIVINKTFHDSIIIINEDVDVSFKNLIYVSNDTLITSDSLIFIFDNLENRITNVIVNRYAPSSFLKASENMLENLTINHYQNISKAFRKMFNSEFHKYSYVLRDSTFKIGERKYVTFFADGKLKGYGNFNKYFMPLNGDLNNVEDGIYLKLSSASDSLNLGLKYYSDSLEIYDLQKTSSVSEKSIYKCNKKVATLLKQKWF